MELKDGFQDRRRQCFPQGVGQMSQRAGGSQGDVIRDSDTVFTVPHHRVRKGPLWDPHQACLDEEGSLVPARPLGFANLPFE